MHVAYEFHDDAAAAPDLGRLWAEHAGWGDGTFPAIAAWLARSPFGRPHAVVAVDRDAGAVVGQCHFYPTVVRVDGRPVRAARPFGVVASRALTRTGQTVGIAAQPVVAMLRHGLRALQARGTQLVYMAPDRRWLGLLRRSPDIQIAEFPLWSRPLPADAPPALPPGYTAAPLEAWDAGVDARVGGLWEATARRHGCAVVRDAAALRWKLGRDPYLVTAVAHGGALVGLAAGKRLGDRQWLVCDVLTADDGEALRATLAAAVAAADAEARAAAGGVRHRQLRKVGVLATPGLQPALGALGFAPDAYQFPLAVQVLDPAVAGAAVAPDRWYVAADD